MLQNGYYRDLVGGFSQDATNVTGPKSHPEQGFTVFQHADLQKFSDLYMPSGQDSCVQPNTPYANDVDNCTKQSSNKQCCIADAGLNKVSVAEVLCLHSNF